MNVKEMKLKHKSLNDIIFVIFFCLILMLPISHISQKGSSAIEYRRLAKYYPLLSDKGVNLNYGKNFDKYFEDRFFLRDIIIGLFQTGLSKINHFISNKLIVFNTKNSWFFEKIELEQSKVKNEKNILSALQQLNVFAQKHHIKLYLLIVPSKIDFYQEYNGLYNKLPKIQYGNTIHFLKKNLSFPIIFPHESLEKAKSSDFIYFKTDHHWTEWGAYIGYQELMKIIKKDFHDIPIITEDDFKIFYDRRVFHTSSGFFGGVSLMRSHIDTDMFILDTPYKYYQPKLKLKITSTNKSKYRTQEFQNLNKTTKLRAILAGTSMGDYLSIFLPHSFKSLKYFRMNSVRDVPAADEYKLLKRYEKDILTYKPDILVLVFSTRNLTGLSNLIRK